MNIGSIKNGYQAAKVNWSTKEVKAEKAEEKVEEGAVVRQDTFERTAVEAPVTYSKNTLTDKQVQQLKDEQQIRWESFEKMLQGMVVKQGQKSNLTLFGMDLFVTEADSAAAAASIAEGGEYSVDAVAGRIMDMAKALSGGDPSKLEELRGAVEKGFAAAGVELGGELPGICQDTYTEVMKRFDEWEAELNGVSAE